MGQSDHIKWLLMYFNTLTHIFGSLRTKLTLKEISIFLLEVVPLKYVETP